MAQKLPGLCGQRMGKEGGTVNDQAVWWRPKFIQSFFVQVVGALALFTGHLDQGGFVTLSTLVIGMFSAASVTENRLMK